MVDVRDDREVADVCLGPWALRRARKRLRNASSALELANPQRAAGEQVHRDAGHERSHERGHLRPERTARARDRGRTRCRRRLPASSCRRDDDAEHRVERARGNRCRPSLRRSSTSSAPCPRCSRATVDERDPPGPEAVEGRVERGVQREVRERDRRRDPVRLQAEERAVQHQHHAVEDEPAENAASARGDDRRLRRRRSARAGRRSAMIGSASTALTTPAGMSRNAIWRSPSDSVSRKPAWSPRARAGRATGRARSRSRRRTFPAGACRAERPCRSPSARGSDRSAATRRSSRRPR